jgi:hypothetical protein
MLPAIIDRAIERPSNLQTDPNLMAHDVFLSYSKKDKLAADAACNVLELNGVRVWMVPRDILPGLGGRSPLQAPPFWRAEMKLRTPKYDSNRKGQR